MQCGCLQRLRLGMDHHGLVNHHQLLDHRQTALHGRNVCAREPAVVDRRQHGMVVLLHLQEQLYHVGVVIFGGQMQRGLALVILGVWVCAQREQGLGHNELAEFGGKMECRLVVQRDGFQTGAVLLMGILIYFLNIFPYLNQHVHHSGVPVLCGQMQWGFAVFCFAEKFIYFYINF